MKLKTRKLLSLLLALVMALCLAGPALASEADPPEKELRWVHLDWDENGRAYASSDALKNDNPGEGNGTGYDPSRQDAVLFFIWNNKTNKREGYVIPEAGDGMRVEKIADVDKNAIAKGAKQSQYYVFLYMDKFQDSELTAKGLTFHVNAVLGDFGFYSAQTLSSQTLLVNEVEAEKLTGDTLYFCAPYMIAGEAKDHDSISKVEKDHGEDDGNAKCYDIEQVKDGLWKLTLNDAGKIALKQWGGVGINLKFEVTQPDGNTREDGRSIFVKGEEQLLWLIPLDSEWDEESGQEVFFVNKDRRDIRSNGMRLQPGEEMFCVLGDTILGDAFDENGNFNWNNFYPVETDQYTLRMTEGLIIENASGLARKGEEWANSFFRITVSEPNEDYTIYYNGLALQINSKLPEISLYSAPTASYDTWMGNWGYRVIHPAYVDEEYYIIANTTDQEDGLHLTDAKLSTANLPEDCGNALMDLEKISSDVYKLSFKKGANLKGEPFHLELDLTWVDFLGNTWTDNNWYLGDFDPAALIMASDTSLTDNYTDPQPFAEIAGQATTELTMGVGEEKEIYLYVSNARQGEFVYSAFDALRAENYRSSDEALTLSFDEKDPAKFTLKADKPGTYQIWIGGKDWDYEGIKLFHANGKEYTEEEKMAWLMDEAVAFTVSDNGTVLVWGADQTGADALPFEEYYDGDTCEIGLRSQDLIDYGWKPLTVTVEAPAKTFADVKESDWFYNEVNWAVRQGIAAGTGADTFSPLDDCTHAHILTFLWRAAGEPESKAELPFTPKNSWAADALAWACEKGMIGDQFDENAKCTSADAVVYIWQAKDKPAAEYDGRFTDVAQDASYAQAVAWAVDAGVTGGNGAGTFGPTTVCSRGRIVTFLYRAFSK